MFSKGEMRVAGLGFAPAPTHREMVPHLKNMEPQTLSSSAAPHSSIFDRPDMVRVDETSAGTGDRRDKRAYEDDGDRGDRKRKKDKHKKDKRDKRDKKAKKEKKSKKNREDHKDRSGRSQGRHDRQDGPPLRRQSSSPSREGPSSRPPPPRDRHERHGAGDRHNKDENK